MVKPAQCWAISKILFQSDPHWNDSLTGFFQSVSFPGCGASAHYVSMFCKKVVKILKSTGPELRQIVAKPFPVHFKY